MIITPTEKKNDTKFLLHLFSCKTSIIFILVYIET